MKINLNGPVAKKIISYGSVVITGVVAVIGALADKKHAQEFEDMKKVVSELQNQIKGS